MSETDTPAPQSPDPAAAATSQTTEDTSAASEQNQAGVPDAPQVQQESEVTAEATTTSEDEGFLGGKYKSKEDFEAAYKELKNTYDSSAQEKAELTRILNEAFTAPETAQVQEQVDDPYAEEPNPLAEKVERMERQGAVQSFIFTHPDANGQAMNEVLAKDPLVAQIQGHDAKLEYAYLKSQNMSSSKTIAEAQKTAAQQAQSKIVEKQAAQVESARKAESTDENSELYERATGNYPQEQRDAARRALIKKNLINL